MVRPSSRTPEDARVTISHVVADPIWSLRPWSVEVSLGALRGVIPVMSAADWLTVLMPERIDLFDIVPGLCGSDMELDVVDGMLNGTLELDAIRRAALDVVSAVSGRPWWFSLRLIKTAVMSWEMIGGELMFRGVDATRLSLSGWLDAVLYLCLRNMEQAKVTMFMSQLEAPPPEELESMPEMEMSADAFLALGRD